MADGVQNPPGDVPQLVAATDLRSLPIGPEDAFVLSRIDGRSSESDLVIATGLTAERIQSILRRLAELGAVVYGATPPPTQPPEPASDSKSGGRLDHPAIEAFEESSSGSSHPAAALYDPSELDEVVDLNLQRKRQILDTFYRLDSSDYYQLLNVARDADKKEIKGAYYQVVSVFHPDKYFGKQLGTFKGKLERIFQTLTEAHDTLTRKVTRTEYDSYLNSQERTRALDRMLSDDRTRAREVDEVRRLIEQQARVLERASARPPAMPQGNVQQGSARSSGLSSGLSSERGAEPPPNRRAADIPTDARRKQAARRLRSSQPPAAASSQPPRGGVQEIVGDDLRRRYDDRLAQARDTQIDHYRRAAAASLAENDPVSAANALRIAVSLVPDDAELAAEYHRVQNSANAALAESYIEQAKYEERNGRFAEAALSYEKAARGRPDNCDLPGQAARCLLEANVNPRKALDLARRAVDMCEARADLRTTLARAYLAADLFPNALTEIELALKLDPEDQTAQLWLRRIKGEV